MKIRFDGVTPDRAFLGFKHCRRETGLSAPQMRGVRNGQGDVTVTYVPLVGAGTLISTPLPSHFRYTSPRLR